MKSVFLGILGLALSSVAGADLLDDVLDRYGSMSQGRVVFQLEPAFAQWKLKSTLVFRRPDRMHYWSETQEGDQPPAQTHVWLDKSQIWVWSSQLGRQEDSPRNVYFTEEHEGGLGEGLVTSSLGPANFVLLLLSGQRKFLEMDEKKSQKDELWTVDGDQMVVDPATRLLKQVIAWHQGQKMASASLTYEGETVEEAELGFTLPEGAKKFDPNR